MKIFVVCGLAALTQTIGTSNAARIGVARESKAGVECTNEQQDGLAKDYVAELRRYLSSTMGTPSIVSIFDLQPWPSDSITAHVSAGTCALVDSLIESYRDTTTDVSVRSAARLANRTLVVVRANPSKFFVDPRLLTGNLQLRFVVDTASGIVSLYRVPW